MNFGHKIGIFYGLFVVFMITMVVLCVQQKDISLVSNDYYKKEIAYQDEIIKQRNVAQLAAPVVISYTGENQQVNISFPEELKGATGTVQFYRPSDAKKDYSLALSINENTVQSIPVNQLAKGLWVVKLEWQKAGKTYLKEEKIVL
ncbi:FixH family protein [Emticicia sp. TH156]|uniref:FixH family protein n=1 Tax=Emticicia sp. TH156 TaxID=2067454 RepID=UPI000C777078|nr:FixH family protein [Emticicia sp. TH156]PLK45152.1 nitrogen fixation protein FixH [Emticicia sp. TH156]